MNKKKIIEILKSYNNLFDSWSDAYNQCANDIIKANTKYHKENFEFDKYANIEQDVNDDCICKCEKPDIFYTVAPFPDYCNYCRKQIIN